MVDLEELPDSRERIGAPVLWLSCEGQTGVWELFSDTSYLSAILVRQGLLVAAQLTLEFEKTQKASHHSYCRAFKIVLKSPTVTTNNFKQKEVIWQQCRLCLAVAQYQIRGGEHFLILGPESGKIWWLNKVQYLQKNHCQWTLLQGKKPKWIFRNLGNLTQPLELVPDSRKHVFPTQWQVRTVLGDCISKAKAVSIQAPQYRQHALISDFLDQAMSSLLKNMIADVQYAINKCEFLGSRKQLVLHGNPSAIAADFSPNMAVLQRHLYAEYAI